MSSSTASATTFAAIGTAGFDLLQGTVRPDCDPDGQVHGYRLAETTIELPLNRAGVALLLPQQAVERGCLPALPRFPLTTHTWRPLKVSAIGRLSVWGEAAVSPTLAPWQAR